MQNNLYSIRFAKEEEFRLLPAIEEAACDMFLETRYASVAHDVNTSDHIDPAQDKVWVAVDSQTGAIAGFAIAYPYDRSVHLNELDVLPRHGRRGIGRRLIAAVIEWAREQGASAITLVTFADIAWNGPFYTGLGFRTLKPNELTPALLAALNLEALAGMPMENRICMQLDL